MRTTVNLDDDLLRAARRYAADHGRTLTSVVEDALREVLSRPQREPPKPFRLVTHGGGGLRPGVDLDSSAELLDVMERDAPA